MSGWGRRRAGAAAQIGGAKVARAVTAGEWRV
jgi:hypothetical protein